MPPYFNRRRYDPRKATQCSNSGPHCRQEVDEGWRREDQGYEANDGTNQAANRRHKVPKGASHVFRPS